MPEITLDAIEELMDQMLDKKLEPIQATLNNHTASLGLLLSKDKIKQDNKEVSTHRLDRLENWGQRVGGKLGIKLEL